MQDSELTQKKDGLNRAFPLMIETESGELNKHPELTVLKPPDDRANQELHPSQIIEASSEANYYKYGWMEDAETTSPINYTAIGSIAALIAICTYLLAGTKLLKFIQFFLLKKQYKHLSLKISQSSIQ